jgi:hypothetical protein
MPRNHHRPSGIIKHSLTAWKTRTCSAFLILLGWLLAASVGCGGDDSAAIGGREGLPVVNWQEARQVIRRRAIVFGEIVDVGGTNNIQFLNFSKRNRDAFVVVIFARSLANFPRPLREM